jgi:ubiquinone/menaquinone biosynthesis C-methylase UbiE
METPDVLNEATAAAGSPERTPGNTPETLMVVESDDNFVDYTNRGHRFRRMFTPLSVGVRRKFYEQFQKHISPQADDAILDIGVTPDMSTEDSNYFERWYPYTARITATSIEDASCLEAVFPGLNFVRGDGARLPFDDRQFDVAFSSAVIEHAGTTEQQREFVAEMLRVSKRYFITTPNRWFPIELHTVLPLLHWLPQRAHQWIIRRLGQRQWATTDTLNLLGKRSLRALFPPDVMPTMSFVRTFGLRSHLIAFGDSHS